MDELAAQEMKDAQPVVESLQNRHRLMQVLQEKAYRAKRNRLGYYAPYEKQREFHEAGKRYQERLLCAANRVGKTFSAGAETSMHLTGRYPDWWKGHEFTHPVKAWAASVTSEVTRDGLQAVLFGTPGVTSDQGCGAIPADALVEVQPKPNMPKAIAMAVVRWGGGGDVQARESVLTLKSYDQGREKFQASTLDLVWLDEEPEHDIYVEALTRTATTNGMLYMTFTPLLGMSQTVKRFLQPNPPPSCHVTKMGIYDALHFTKERADEMLSRYPEHEREARGWGIPKLGDGAVFPIDESKLAVDPFEIPRHWHRICGLDIGWNHPTAAVWLAHDRESGSLYVTDVYKQSKQPVPVHASAIKGRGDWIPVAWPHDALQAQKDTGKPMRDAYRNEGVRMLPERAAFEDGSFALEPRVNLLLNLMQKGQFKVFRNLEPWFAEFRNYHRKDGEIVKEDDDLMSATQYAFMMRRFAKAQAAQVLSIYRTHWRA